MRTTDRQARHSASVGFYASTDYLELASNIWSGGRFTVAGWAIVDRNTGTYRALFSVEPGTAPWYGQGYFWDGVASGFFNQAMTDGLPFWAAMTNDGTSLRGYLRRNERVMEADLGALTGNGTTFTSIRIGNDSLDEHLGGRMWNVRIWREALTRSELHREAMSTCPLRVRDLHGWYPLEGRRFERDASGAGNHLTIGGAPRLAAPFLPRRYIPPVTQLFADPGGGSPAPPSPGAGIRAFYFA